MACESGNVMAMKRNRAKSNLMLNSPNADSLTFSTQKIKTHVRSPGVYHKRTKNPLIQRVFSSDDYLTLNSQ
jgi:hypothetical protein